jgi:hypothetical protein
VLREAKELVVRRWFGAEFQPLPNPREVVHAHCVFTAIVAAGGGMGETYKGAERALERTAGMSFEDIIRWNNAPGRTHAEVVDLFDRALAAKGTR